MSSELTGGQLIIHDRLMNWGAWARTGVVVGRCGSAEGCFRPEKLTEAEDEKRKGQQSIDVDEAEETEAAIAFCPPHHRWFIEKVYSRRFHWLRVCKLLRLHQDMYEVMLVRVIWSVEEGIDRVRFPKVLDSMALVVV